MTRTLMALVAVGGLTLSAAMAQSPSSPAPPAPSPPAASPSMSQDKGSQDKGAMGSNTASPASQAISQQTSDQWLFSKFKGTNVIGNDEAKIGDVSDVLFDKTGKVNALVIGVGGFLGIGTKDVALPVAAFQVVTDPQGGADKLRLSMTKDQLQQTADFKPMQKPASTTGTAPPAGRPASPPAGTR